MRYLVLAVVIGFPALGLPALAVADVAPLSSQQTYRAQLESLYRCQWLMATGEEEQEQQQEDETGEDDEPDCD